MLKLKLGAHWGFHNELGAELNPQQLFDLLAALREHGKLGAAARASGISYRHAWGLLEKSAAVFGQELVAMSRGRGTRLSALGEKLLAAQQRVCARLGPQLESLAAELELELGELLPDSPVVLRIDASHDLALARLRDTLLKGGGPRLNLQFRGSVASLISLSKGHCEVAGFHVPDGAIGEVIAQRYKPWLKPRTDRLVRFVRRQQGLIVASGNPLGVCGVADIARAKARFINRQLGSGTRLIFDAMLDLNGITPMAVEGYYAEEFTHFAVATSVAAGHADVGFGVEAAARQFNLDFIPLVAESYYLAARTQRFAQPVLKQLLELLRGPQLRQIVAALPGYAADAAGELIAVKDAMPGA
ncbi:MAG: substrate-binding domain-containing protein [Burkholderiales bacterium]